MARRRGIRARNWLLFAASIAGAGCMSHRMAITGAICGVVTGPVSCVTSTIRGDATPLIVLPLSPLLGVFGGWELGRRKDWDFAEYGAYSVPGTWQLSRVFEPFRDWPMGLPEEMLEPGIRPLRASFLRIEGGCRSILVDELSTSFGVGSPVELDAELTRLLRLSQGELATEAIGEPGEAGGRATLVYSALHGFIERDASARWRYILLDAQKRLEADPSASLSSRELFEAHYALVSPECRKAWLRCVNATPLGIVVDAREFGTSMWFSLQWLKPTTAAPDVVRILAVRMRGLHDDMKPFAFECGTELGETAITDVLDASDYPYSCEIPFIAIDTDQGPIVRVFASDVAGFVRHKPVAPRSAADFDHPPER